MAEDDVAEDDKEALLLKTKIAKVEYMRSGVVESVGLLT